MNTLDELIKEKIGNDSEDSSEHSILNIQDQIIEPQISEKLIISTGLRLGLNLSAGTVKLIQIFAEDWVKQHSCSPNHVDIPKVLFIALSAGFSAAILSGQKYAPEQFKRFYELSAPIINTAMYFIFFYNFTELNSLANGFETSIHLSIFMGMLQLVNFVIAYRPEWLEEARETPAFKLTTSFQTVIEKTFSGLGPYSAAADIANIFYLAAQPVDPDISNILKPILITGCVAGGLSSFHPSTTALEQGLEKLFVAYALVLHTAMSCIHCWADLDPLHGMESMVYWYVLASLSTIAITLISGISAYTEHQAQDGLNVKQETLFALNLPGKAWDMVSNLANQTNEQMQSCFSFFKTEDAKPLHLENSQENYGATV